MRLTADLWVKTFSYLESDLPSLSSPNEFGVLAYYLANALPISASSSADFYGLLGGSIYMGC